jgi:heat shock protein HslJ
MNRTLFRRNDMGTRRTVWVRGVVLAAVAGCTPTPEIEQAAEPAAPAPVAEFEGTSWIAESIAGEPVAEGIQSTISFGADEQVTGNAGCNGYFGAWATDGEMILFGHLGATMMMCPEEQMDQEESFMEALGSAERFEVREGKLYIFSAGGDPPLVLRAHTAERVAPTDD